MVPLDQSTVARARRGQRADAGASALRRGRNGWLERKEPAATPTADAAAGVPAPLIPQFHSFTSTWMVLTPEMTTSPPSISISRDFGIARLGDAREAGLRARQDQRHRGRRIGHFGAFQLEGRVGAPHPHVGLVVGVQTVYRGDDLAGGVRRGGEHRAEIREVGGVGVGHGEVERARLGADGHLHNPACGWFRRRFRRSAAPGAAPSRRGAPRGCESERPSISSCFFWSKASMRRSTLLQPQGVEAALHHVGQRDGGGQRSLQWRSRYRPRKCCRARMGAGAF